MVPDAIYGRRTGTYIAPWGPSGQSLVSIVVDIQRVSSATPFLGRYIRLAVVVRADRRAAVDDLDDNTVAFAVNGSTAVAASVGDLVAGAAVAFGAGGTLVAGDDILPVTLGVVDVGVAKSTGDIR